MKTKTLFWISGIMGVLFILVAIILRLSGKIQGGSLVVSIVVILIIAILINFVFWYTQAKKEVTTLEKIKAVSIPEAESEAKRLLLEKHFEYKKEELVHNVGEKGERNTPVLKLLWKGEYDGKLYGITINMLDIERSSIVEYDESKIPIDKIKEELEIQANNVAFAPSPDKLFKTRSLYDPITGRRIVEKEPIDTEKDKEGGLK